MQKAIENKVPERYFIGDDCICWSFGNKIQIEVNRKVILLYRILKHTQLAIRDIVPAYKGLAVYFDPATPDIPKLIKEIETIILENANNIGSNQIGTKIILPVIYDGEDLSRVAGIHHLTVEEVIKKHVAPIYQVALIGFSPFFPYLIGLDIDLITPRLESPRKHVPSGSVAIGGEQTGIYPEDSPGGWNLIGRTNPDLLKRIKPGDSVLFKEDKF